MRWVIEWCGHVHEIGEESLMKHILQWRPSGRRMRERPRKNWLEEMKNQMGKELLNKQNQWTMKDRWRLGVRRRRIVPSNRLDISAHYSLKKNYIEKEKTSVLWFYEKELFYDIRVKSDLFVSGSISETMPKAELSKPANTIILLLICASYTSFRQPGL